MAERQETSVMVSIQEILRDAQSREEQEKVEAERRVREEEQRRLDEIRLRQQQEQDRLRAEEEDRRRRAFEEQKRQAELSALQEAAIARARMEAEAQARLAEMSSRQEHERQLHALSQDKSKRQLQIFLAGLGVLLFALAIGGGVMIKGAIDKANAAEARTHELEAKQEQAESEKRRLMAEMEAAKDDPAKAAALRDALAAAQRRIDEIRKEQTGARKTTAVAPTPPKSTQGQSAKPCNCTPGDPLCSCL
jgi:colicin import membrane protein